MFKAERELAKILEPCIIIHREDIYNILVKCDFKDLKRILGKIEKKYKETGGSKVLVVNYEFIK